MIELTMLPNKVYQQQADDPNFFYPASLCFIYYLICNELILIIF